MTIPFDMSIRVTNSNQGYEVTVTLDSKDFSHPWSVTQKKVYNDLSDISDLRQQTIDVFNQKMSELV